ncbi:TPA: histidine phosphatase family protein [Streptococcus suis]|uniref:histidine phosphatase family protein n=1 Tax=Streptococcus suis TaxID=1307 RepID=UPI000CF5C15A|nr:histidine phosphatase family protein [Streptococcus suis]MCK3867209.1 histidine phosphatase family protein [Streptococcus suis]MCK3871059.1 histidine phosphatase family protein [Streptococcus suis]NQJ49302.1 histidine phosphatase family protein [Streptococcus suis]NQJ51456.1 histidine phosphatase family protein [Streptococcus suis]NQJ55744.1 histidine phosphatase family protein [Streptococcus suis]
MQILFVRHSEPDYSMFDQHDNPRLYAGFGRDLAPLTEKGRALAQKVASSPVFAQAQVVIASSVTRALETATYIAQAQQLPLLVEPFFHEWRPDMTGQNASQDGAVLAHRLFLENSGAVPESSPVRYETAAEMRERFLQALEKYKAYDRIVIVCHGMLIRQFVPKETIAYCEILEYTL